MFLSERGKEEKGGEAGEERGARRLFLLCPLHSNKHYSAERNNSSQKVPPSSPASSFIHLPYLSVYLSVSLAVYIRLSLYLSIILHLPSVHFVPSFFRLTPSFLSLLRKTAALKKPALLLLLFSSRKADDDDHADVVDFVLEILLFILLLRLSLSICLSCV